jgi:hypothetical protein
MRPEMQAKIANLPEGPKKFMEKAIEAAAGPFAESIGISIEQAKRAVTQLIDKGLAKIEIEGLEDDPSTWRARLILTEEGEANQ